MSEERRRLEMYRKSEAGPLENTLLDEVLDGEFDRAAFIRRGTMLGVSASVIGTVLAALGEAPLAFASPTGVRAGGRIRIGIIPPPVGPLEPHKDLDPGSVHTESIAGEFLTRATQGLTLLPELATRWTPNKTATVWTYQLRPNVRFQSGQQFGADDVVATYNRLVDPNSGSSAISAFKGVLSPGSIKKIDNLTVQFNLDAANPNFPYLTSSTTYQGIILPANYQLGTFDKSPQTTAAFKLVSYSQGVGARFDRFDGWWGGRAPLDGADVTYYSDDAAIVAAVLGNQVDLINTVRGSAVLPLLKAPAVQIFSTRGASHSEIAMRVDLNNPLRDYRVRQAIALTLDRPALVKTLFRGRADVGNDSPFAPVYPSTVKSVPQRHKDLRLAKQLMQAAGHSKGFSVKLTTDDETVLPAVAQILQRSVTAIGVKLAIQVMTPTKYFAGSQLGPPSGWGNTPWLNAPISMTAWGHRAVPNVLLSSALTTKAVWNAAHYSNKAYDRLVKSYTAAVSLKDQRKYAKQIEELLLHDTPTMFPYFDNFLSAGSKRVVGFKVDGLGLFYLAKTSLA